MNLETVLDKHRWDIWALAHDGAYNSQIAEKLGVSPYLVSNARAHLAAPQSRGERGHGTLTDAALVHHEAIRQGILEGRKTREIGQEIGFTGGMVTRAARRLGLEVPRFQRQADHNEERSERIIAAREAGQNLREIAGTYAISRERVRQILNQAGRPDLCPGSGFNPRPAPAKDHWFRNKQRMGADLRASRILALRRQWKGWHEVGAIIYPDMSPGWACRRCVTDIKRLARRHNLDVSAAFYNLNTIKARWKEC